MTFPRRFALRGCLAVLFLGCLSAPASTAAGGGETRVARVRVRGSRDAYVLSRGHSSMTADASLEDIEALRKEWSDVFLWVRRGGHEFLIRDARTIEDGRKLFDPVRALEPDHQVLRGRQERLESEQNALEQQEEEIDAELEALDPDEDDDADVRPVAVSSDRPALEKRKREIAEKMHVLESRERELEAAENELDRRSDVLEEKAEKTLWRLIDRALEKGLGRSLDD